jgi:hypothetical protein
MTRRKLFGLIPIPLIPWWRRQQDTAAIDRGLLEYRQGPTMDELIRLAEGPGLIARPNPYYAFVLGKALRVTGPIAYNREISQVGMYWSFDLLGGIGERYHVVQAKSADDVLIPVDLLKHIRPKDRPYDFPRGIAFEPMK